MGSLQEEVHQRQVRLVQRMLDQEKPVELTIQGMRIWGFPKVFHPHADTILLAESVEVNPDEEVLETCAGTGYISLRIVNHVRSIDTVDCNPDAVENIGKNISLHGCGERMHALQADMFPDKKYNVIIANPPYSDSPARNMSERAVWDEGHAAIKKFLDGAKDHLLPGGRIYVSWANFAGADIKSLAERLGYVAEEVNRSMPNEIGCVYYVYELRPA